MSFICPASIFLAYRDEFLGGVPFFRIRIFVDESVAFVLGVLEAFLNQPLTAREIANNREKEMYRIFIEEVQPYLLGQKSAEDVAKIIQSRLQLYLDEG